MPCCRCTVIENEHCSDTENSPAHKIIPAPHTGDKARIDDDQNKDLHGLDKNTTEFREYLLQRIFPLLHGFPGYMQVFGIAVVDECWTVENELLTPTLKLKRHAITARHEVELNEIYQGHDALDG
jgi:long-subunit acyl-CoA synthetase (AMP-forming)